MIPKEIHCINGASLAFKVPFQQVNYFRKSLKFKMFRQIRSGTENSQGNSVSLSITDKYLPQIFKRV
jgi:hypothetical protein